MRYIKKFKIYEGYKNPEAYHSPKFELDEISLPDIKEKSLKEINSRFFLRRNLKSKKIVRVNFRLNGGLFWENFY